MNVTWHCDVCGEPVLKGRMLIYTYPDGYEKDDGVDGEYFDGCGRCEICGRDLCVEHGDFENGICEECREELEKEEVEE
jgi:hypothetical protein